MPVIPSRNCANVSYPSILQTSTVTPTGMEGCSIPVRCWAMSAGHVSTSKRSAISLRSRWASGVVVFFMVLQGCERLEQVEASLGDEARPGRSRRGAEDRLVAPLSTCAGWGRRRAGISVAGCRATRYGVVVMLCDEASEAATVVDGRSLPRLIRECSLFRGSAPGVLSYVPVIGQLPAPSSLLVATESRGSVPAEPDDSVHTSESHCARLRPVGPAGTLRRAGSRVSGGWRLARL